MKSSLIKLISYYNYECQGVPLYIPLVGTGRSRLNMEYIESFNTIKDVLIENANKIQGKINILVFYKDAEEVEEELEKCII